MVIYGVGNTDKPADVDHDRNLDQFLQRCRQKGIKLNKWKLKLKCTEFPYLGHLVTKEGLKPDLDKMKPAQEMPQPDNIKAVRRFCGFVNYLAKFMPKLRHGSHLRQNLDKFVLITKISVKFLSSADHAKCDLLVSTQTKTCLWRQIFKVLSSCLRA